MRSNSGKSEWISAFTLTKPKYQKINHLNGITASLTVSVSQTQKKNTQKKRSIPRFKFTALLLSKAGGSLELNSPSWELRGWESTHIPTTPNYPKQHSLYNQHNRAQLSSLGFFVVQKRKKSEASHYSNTHSAKHSILDTVLRPKLLALQLDLWFAKPGGPQPWDCIVGLPESGVFSHSKTPVAFDRYCNIHHKNNTKKVINSNFGWLYLLSPPAFFLHNCSTRFKPGRKKKQPGGLTFRVSIPMSAVWKMSTLQDGP